jgi:hypothetical protein
LNDASIEDGESYEASMLWDTSKERPMDCLSFNHDSTRHSTSLFAHHIAIHKHLSTTQLIVNLIDNTIKMGGGGEKLPGQYVDLPRAPKRTSSKLPSFT